MFTPVQLCLTTEEIWDITVPDPKNDYVRLSRYYTSRHQSPKLDYTIVLIIKSMTYNTSPTFILHEVQRTVHTSRIHYLRV